MDNMLNNKVILITGAGSGIGTAAAMAFANAGATVILLGRTIAKLEKVFDDIVDANFPKPGIYPMNLEGAGIHDYLELANIIEREFGRLDSILHNAAIWGESTSIEHYDPEIWARVMQVNLNAPYLLTRACIPLLKKTRDASVIFTAHDVNTAHWGAYGVSKAGLLSMMRILADELDTANTKVRVNAISPGDIRSPMNVRAYPGKSYKSKPGPDSIMDTYINIIAGNSNTQTGEYIKL